MIEESGATVLRAASLGPLDSLTADELAAWGEMRGGHEKSWEYLVATAGAGAGA